MFLIGATPNNMVNFDAKIHLKSLERSFNKLSTDKSGRTQSGIMRNFLVGTYYNYSMTIVKGNCNNMEWDHLWDLISSAEYPQYYIKVPYNQGQLTFQAYITSASQKCKKLKKGLAGSVDWGEITCQFVACKPCKTTGNSSTNNPNYTYVGGTI